MKISITGTPGVGKTVISKKIAKKLKYQYIDLNDIIIKNKLYSKYDRKSKSYVVDTKKLKKLKIGDNVIIDGHLSHFLNIDKIVVLRCDQKELKKRLKKKKWSKRKVQENLEAELIGVISYESRKTKKTIFDIDTTKKTISKIVDQTIRYLKTNKSNKSIDWCY